MTLFNKVKWVLGISVVFLLILMTNLIDKNAFIKIEETVEKIYEERLLTKELVLELSQKIHEKEIAHAKQDTAYFVSRNKVVDQEVDRIIQSLENAECTKEEERAIADLKGNYDRIRELEKSQDQDPKLLAESIEKLFYELKYDIDKLSKVQMAEGKKQKKISENVLKSAELFSRIEIYILIFLGVVLQIIILSSPKKKKEVEE